MEISAQEAMMEYPHVGYQKEVFQMFDFSQSKTQYPDGILSYQA